MQNAEILFAALKGQPFNQSQFVRLDSQPGLRAAFEPTTRPQMTERGNVDLGALHEAHQLDRVLSLSRQRELLAATIELAESNGAGETPKQGVVRSKLDEMWADYRATDDESERGRIASDILKLTATAEPSKLAAAKRELARIDREIEETIEGGDAPARGSLVANAEKRKREFEASRRPARAKFAVKFQG